jgi:protein ImuB
MTEPSASRRYASVWLRRLSADRIMRRRRQSGALPLDAPLVVVGDRKGALCIVALDDDAAALGLVEDMALAEARARFPLLEVAHEEPRADAKLLESVAEYCRRWTPLIACDAPDGIFLDITGCAHLFGGEAGLGRDLRARLTRQGFHVRVAIASTPGAAWALARFGMEAILPAGGEKNTLAKLPLAALRIDGETVAALARVGLKKVGDLYELPRAPLAARFGKTLLERLDCALGRLEEPLSPRLEVAPYIAERPFPEPIGREEDVLGAVSSLAEKLSAMLERRGEGARRLELSLFRADGAVFTVTAATSRATHDAGAIADLFSTRLHVLRDELDPGFGFDLVRFSVLAADRIDAAQADLAGPDNAEELARLIDHLGARLGPSRIVRQEAFESHLPERAVLHVAVGGVGAAAWKEIEPETPPARPMRLLLKPEPVEEVVAMVPDGPPARFRWRHVVHEVTRAEGPERIADEWWRTPESRPTRDYFRVEDKEGRRFWLFREGLFGREHMQPTWFMHGTFA